MSYRVKFNSFYTQTSEHVNVHKHKYLSLCEFYSVESSIERRGTGTREKKRRNCFHVRTPRGYRANRKRYTMRYTEHRTVTPRIKIRGENSATRRHAFENS